MKTYIIILITLIMIAQCTSQHDRKIIEKRILDALLNPKKYDPRIRPADPRGPAYPVTVNISMYILDIYDEDTYLKDFTFQCYLRQSWKDSRLVFKGVDSSIREIDITDLQAVWKPNLLVRNELGSLIHELLEPNVQITIFQDGTVFMTSRISMIVKCNTNLKYYPHDQQRCRITIESFGSYADDLLLQWDEKLKSGYDETISNPRYKLLDVKISSPQESSQNDDDRDPTLYVDLLFTRSTASFMWTLYLPFLVLIILSWGAFYINPEKFSVRASFLALILLLMLNLAPDFHEHRGVTGSATALEFWTLGCIAFFIFAAVEFVYVHNLVTQATEEEEPKSKAMEEFLMENGEKTSDKKDVNRLPLKDRLQSKEYWKQYRDNASMLDVGCRNVAFPVLFTLFNIIYWCVTSSGQCSTLDEWFEKYKK